MSASVAGAAAVWPDFKNGIIAICSPDTQDEVFDRQLIGLPGGHWRSVSQLANDVSAIFVHNPHTKQLWGGMVANGYPERDIVPVAFNRPYRSGDHLLAQPTMEHLPMSLQGHAGSVYPAQCRFNYLYECKPIQRQKYALWRKALFESQEVEDHGQPIGARLLDARQVQVLLQFFKPVRDGKIAGQLKIPTRGGQFQALASPRADDRSSGSSDSSSSQARFQDPQQFPVLGTATAAATTSSASDAGWTTVVGRKAGSVSSSVSSSPVGQKAPPPSLQLIKRVSSGSSTTLPVIHPPESLPPEDLSNYPFLHEELYRPECKLPATLTSCVQWALGNCKLGERCRFYHGAVICRDFQWHGSCVRGVDYCVFVHDQLDHERYVNFGKCEIMTGIYPEDRAYWEKQPRLRDPRKFRTCNAWYRNRCPKREAECTYLHRPTICRSFHQTGSCPHGDRCLHLHDAKDRQLFLAGSTDCAPLALTVASSDPPKSEALTVAASESPKAPAAEPRVADSFRAIVPSPAAPSSSEQRTEPLAHPVLATTVTPQRFQHMALVSVPTYQPVAQAVPNSFDLPSASANTLLFGQQQQAAFPAGMTTLYRDGTTGAAANYYAQQTGSTSLAQLSAASTQQLQALEELRIRYQQMESDLRLAQQNNQVYRTIVQQQHALLQTMSTIEVPAAATAGPSRVPLGFPEAATSSASNHTLPPASSSSPFFKLFGSRT